MGRLGPNFLVLEYPIGVFFFCCVGVVLRQWSFLSPCIVLVGSS